MIRASKKLAHQKARSILIQDDSNSLNCYAKHLRLERLANVSPDYAIIRKLRPESRSTSHFLFCNVTVFSLR